MSGPELIAPDLAALNVPSDGHEPVFAEPWQAQAFALVVQLHAQGAFTWPDWAAALAETIAAAPHAPYYESWVKALERMTESRGLADPAALADRKAAWAEAYRVTPHGRPVELGAKARSAGQGDGATSDRSNSLA